MNYRRLGKTGMNISEISLGTWQVGGKWGAPFNHSSAEKIINDAIDNGINFIDTADVYSDGESEKAVGKVVKSRSEQLFIATKCGRQFNPHTNESYTVEGLRSYVEGSLKNMQIETIDLIQLHCPPTEVFYRDEIFALFDDLKQEGKIQHLGVSIEKLEEGIQAMNYPNVSSIQVIFNIFRQKPLDSFLELAHQNDVGIIARVPLASGLLTGKFNAGTVFEKDDHRNFNRNGEVFDKGETFSGVDYNLGLEAVDALKRLFPENTNLAPIALKWILMHKEVSCTIPGASQDTHLSSNLEALNVADLSDEQMAAIKNIYEEYIKEGVHQNW